MDISVYEGTLISSDTRHDDTYTSVADALAAAQSLQRACVVIENKDKDSFVLLYVWTGTTLIDLTK